MILLVQAFLWLFETVIYLLQAIDLLVHLFYLGKWLVNGVRRSYAWLFVR